MLKKYIKSLGFWGVLCRSLFVLFGLFLQTLLIQSSFLELKELNNEVKYYWHDILSKKSKLWVLDVFFYFYFYFFLIFTVHFLQKTNKILF